MLDDTGNDTLNAVDATADSAIDCGDATGAANVDDAIDPTQNDDEDGCETVNRF